MSGLADFYVLYEDDSFATDANIRQATGQGETGRNIRCNRVTESIRKKKDGTEVFFVHLGKVFGLSY